MIELKRFKITYKNGVVRETKAYSMQLEDGKLYICDKAWIGDQGVPGVINGTNIAKVECLGRA